MAYLHTFLCLLMLLCGLLVAFSNNPVEAVLFLVFTFLNAGVILFFFNAEFFGLIFIIIYVGAVSVLFLFIVMMLNVKTEYDFSTNNFKTKIVKVLFCFLAIFILIFKINALFGFNKLDTSNFNFAILFDELNNIDILGQTLYNYYLICFLVAGLILLIALVGAITLTLRYHLLKKSQLYTRQLARTDNFLSFFK